MKRRPIEVFSLSFLDCICCGFGALILLFVMVNAHKRNERAEVVQDLSAEVRSVEAVILEARRDHVEARNTLERTRQDLVVAQGRSAVVLSEIESNRLEIARYRKETLATREHVNKLQADLRALEEGKKRLEAGGPAKTDGGDKVAAFPGEGDRHYLTGVKMGGKRVLFLVDASASMLSDQVVDVIRLRNQPEAQRKAAPKWRHATRSLEWLLAQLPVEAEFQVITFAETAGPLLPEHPGWMRVADAPVFQSVMPAVRGRVPAGGTSLFQAFEAARALQPAPDNIFLLTDGLPTQGAGKPRPGTVSGSRRLKLFDEALARLGAGIPVNVLLFPMEGDPLAPSAFWRLCIQTRGSFLCPPGDWP